jgi:hypothetical protein
MLGSLGLLVRSSVTNWQLLSSHDWRIDSVGNGLALFCPIVAFGLLPLVTREVGQTLGRCSETSGGRVATARNGAIRTVMCSEAIEHIRDCDSALAEFRRLFDIGGAFILSTPIRFSVRSLTRAAGRVSLRGNLTSGDQPYDRCHTWTSLETKLEQASLAPRKRLGFWFLPQLRKGMQYRLPDPIVVSLLCVLMPPDRALRTRVPRLGHPVYFVSETRRPRTGCPHTPDAHST